MTHKVIMVTQLLIKKFTSCKLCLHALNVKVVTLSSLHSWRFYRGYTGASKRRSRENEQRSREGPREQKLFAFLLLRLHAAYSLTRAHVTPIKLPALQA